MKHEFDVREFGAKGDGATLDTAALQTALDAAAEHGGRVVVPPGKYLSGTLVLKSHVTLDLRQNATLQGSPRLEDYQHPLGWGWPHDDQNCDVTPWHLVQALDAEDVVITGEGTIAGNGPAFWYPDRPHDWHFWVHRENQRPSPMVHIENCRHVRVENVTLRESAGWTLHLHNCEDARITGLTIRNTYFGPNTDGMDISNCRGVRISDCDVATGDDAIALMASAYGGPSEDIAITNCVLRTSCVGLRIIGFDGQAVHRRISASNLVIPRCSRVADMICQNGTLIEHVSLAHCVASTNCGWPINRPFEIVAANGVNPHGNRTSRPGLIRDVSIQDFDILTDGRILLLARDPNRVEDIRLRDIRLRYALLDDPTAWAKGTSAETDDLAGYHRAKAAVVAQNIKNLTLRDFSIAWPEYPVPEGWHLLKTEWRRTISREIYEGHGDRIRRGEMRPTFKAFWGRRLAGGSVDLRGLTDSEGGAADEVAGSTCAVLR